MRLDRLDLNLLVTLDVLLAERSVSAAGRRLHLSQPAVSGALGRLRDFFGDELLVQVGRQMVPTAKAEELAAPIREALALIRTRITTPARFDPQTSARRFTLVASDYVFTVLLADVLAGIAEAAPGLSFDLLAPEPPTIELLARGEADLLIAVETYTRPDWPGADLFEDDHAVICWAGAGHPDTIDAAAFTAATHAISYIGPGRFPSFAEAYFDAQGIVRSGAVHLPSYTLLPQAVVGTQRLATLPRRYAEYWARLLPLRILPLPFAMPRFRERAQWHPLREGDAGLAWLVERIRDPSAEAIAAIR